MPRVFAPDEELPFHFTVAEVNTLIGLIENTTGFPLRVTAPLREKILTQVNAPPTADADGLDKQAPASALQPPPAVELGPGGTRSRRNA